MACTEEPERSFRCLIASSISLAIFGLFFFDDFESPASAAAAGVAGLPFLRRTFLLPPPKDCLPTEEAAGTSSGGSSSSSSSSSPSSSSSWELSSLPSLSSWDSYNANTKGEDSWKCAAKIP